MAKRCWDKITDHTIKVLEDNGFLTKKSICLIQYTDIQRMFVRPLDQQRLLQDLISRGSAAIAPPVPQDQHPPCPQSGTTANPLAVTSMVITDQLKDLLSALPSVPSIEGAVSSDERVDLNPLVYLMHKTSWKALDILDFVCSGVMESEETVVQGTTRSQVVLTSGAKTS